MPVLAGGTAAFGGHRRRRPLAGFPRERGRGVTALMLSDLVRSRVTVVLPGQEVQEVQEVREVWEVGGGMKQGICFPSYAQTSNLYKDTGPAGTPAHL